MKRTKKRLQLNLELVRPLEAVDDTKLRRVAGGGSNHPSGSGGPTCLGG
jgi:hypothetical protein